MLPVSALLIVRNEAAYIERCLGSLLWCDEILIIDAYSEDRTEDLCMDPRSPWAEKVRFLKNPWPGFSAQRNFAIQHARHPWVLFVDADEACSPELTRRIQDLLGSPDLTPAQYKIRRQEFFLKKPIHHGIWNPSYHVRFFHKENFEFVGEVHEGVKSSLPEKKLDEPLIHVEDLRIERILSKLNHYTSIQAETDFHRGRRTSLARILLAFPAMFYKNYIYYGAWRDGIEGTMISVLEGISRTVRHLKIWQLTRIESRDRPQV